jgi:hypothetical protein
MFLVHTHESSATRPSSAAPALNPDVYASQTYCDLQNKWECSNGLQRLFVLLEPRPSDSHKVFESQYSETHLGSTCTVSSCTHITKLQRNSPRQHLHCIFMHTHHKATAKLTSEAALGYSTWIDCGEAQHKCTCMHALARCGSSVYC